MTPAERDAALLPPDALLAALPALDLDADRRTAAHPAGRPIDAGGRAGRGLARVYGPGRRFLGLAEVPGQGRVVPRRLMSQPPWTQAIA